MLVHTKILRTKGLSSIVLLLYSVLYLCIIFHYHPVNLQLTGEHSFLLPHEVPVEKKQSVVHCEICHIQSNFNAELFSPIATELSNHPEVFRFVYESSFKLTNQFALPDLRAPPAA